MLYTPVVMDALRFLDAAIERDGHHIVQVSMLAPNDERRWVNISVFTETGRRAGLRIPDRDTMDAQTLSLVQGQDGPPYVHTHTVD